MGLASKSETIRISGTGKKMLFNQSHAVYHHSQPLSCGSQSEKNNQLCFLKKSSEGEELWPLRARQTEAVQPAEPPRALLPGTVIEVEC
ncbi:hypothetical protein NDU88_007617 [Pleurodeles waltl]|uniref:Uncharacterized protein n=1 Tax=Pleurodeles waltl TaxID=8319 RepID=A0AAV7U0K4_PLEWA|nr:hypothetical protein NDU88_007617 [Pleurodeles waltl]